MLGCLGAVHGDDFVTDEVLTRLELRRDLDLPRRVLLNHLRERPPALAKVRLGLGGHPVPEVTRDAGGGIETKLGELDPVRVGSVELGAVTVAGCDVVKDGAHGVHPGVVGGQTGHAVELAGGSRPEDLHSLTRVNAEGGGRAGGALA